MPDRLSILCVHGIGHGDVDAALIPAWRQVITAGLQRWKPGLEVDFDFLAYDEEFDHAPLHAATYAEALTRLAASGITQPAWLHPNMPTSSRLMSLRVFKYSNAAMTSPARSSNDALFQVPVERPTPRLS